MFLTSHEVEFPRASLAYFCNPREARVDQLFQGLTRLSERLVERGSSLHLAVVPSKLSLYGERLPATLPTRLRQNCVDRVANNELAVHGLKRRSPSFCVFYPREEMFALRDTPHFYPPESFHANSRLNYEFTVEYLRELGVSDEPIPAKASLETIDADLTLMGFEREVKAWVYNYAQGITRYRRAPEWLRPVYKGARGFGRYKTEAPLSNQKVLMLSDSFGAYFAPHLASGFSELMHVNIKHLRASEVEQFLETALRESGADRVILLVHDAGLLNQSLRRFLDAVP
ncbi:MAG: hypothetical protein AAGG55_07405 [Pseudomonadota bacterium]